MIKGIGVDICDLRRLTSLDSLAKKILHEEELKIFCQKKNEKAKREFLGGRFAGRKRRRLAGRKRERLTGRTVGRTAGREKSYCA